MGSEQKAPPSWVTVISKYNRPDKWKSIWQIMNSLVPYIILWVLMVLSLDISYWITLGLSVLAAGFLVRIFIIFHDCGHHAFFRSEKANKIVGTILGSLTFTPYERWHSDHATHHQTVGNLDKRGSGDVWTLTVEEYQQLSRRDKFIYRLYRHPIILFGIAPVLLFVIWFRFTNRSMSAPERKSVYITNLILLVTITGLILLIGWRAYLLIQLPVIYIASGIGVWLFYVQHQFEDVIWVRQAEWDYKKIALEGSSYLKLPGILQWFSGNIGFHHIHHLSPRIPNYYLEKCQKENEMFSEIKPVTILPALRTMKFRLWDEQAGRLISFRQLKRQAAHA
ncbi:MAG TPA: fatty acid desaturase [Bacteroides sp.]|nr:fatty acid desaturase [Bacteroides sp.]